MTLSINNEFDWEGIQVKISLPSNYDPNQIYPAILLNMETWISYRLFPNLRF